jgi:hypothetical protein
MGVEAISLQTSSLLTCEREGQTKVENVADEN